MTLENRRENARSEWQLSRDAWRGGELLLAGDDPRGALTRFYYAAFHAACAAVLTEGLEPTIHAGVRFQLSEHFIKTGRLPRELGKDLTRLQQEREDADYDRNLKFDERQALDAREDAGRICEQIHQWMTQNGWL